MQVLNYIGLVLYMKNCNNFKLIMMQKLVKEKVYKSFNGFIKNKFICVVYRKLNFNVCVYFKEC